MGEGLTKAAARNIFYGGSIFFFLVFAGLVAHSHYYALTSSSDEAGLTEAVKRGKAVWERNACIDCHTILGEGAYFAPELGNVWVRYGGRDDPEGAREALKAWMSPAHRRRGPPADAALQPHRPGARRPRRFLRVDQPHRHAGLAAERGGLSRRRERRDEYPTQRIAYAYFSWAMALFAVQVLFGAARRHRLRLAELPRRDWCPSTSCA